MDALRFARVVVVKQELSFFGEDWLGFPVVAKLRRTRAANYLLGRNAIHLFGIDAHEVLSAAGDNMVL
jgi:hypothetical protein